MPLAFAARSRSLVLFPPVRFLSRSAVARRPGGLPSVRLRARVGRGRSPLGRVSRVFDGGETRLTL